MAVSRRRRRSFRQSLHDNNPFYLLSAACMLLACVLLSNSTSWLPIGLGRLVALIVTLNVYELLLVGLGLFLIARRNLVRDGVMLLVLEAFFLADVGFLASEAYQHGLTAGLCVSGALLALGVVKLVAVFRVLRMPLGSPAFGGVLATLVVLLGHPAVLKWVSNADNGRVPMGLLYAGWWVAAGLVVAYGLSLRTASPKTFRGGRPGTARAGIGHVLAGVLLVGLVAHLATAHWVYKSPFAAADLSPLLAATAVLLAGVPTGRFFRRQDAAALCFLLPVAGVLCSIDGPAALSLHAGPFTLSASTLAMMASYLAIVDSFAPAYFVRFAVAGLAAGAVYALGPTWATLQVWISSAYRVVADWCDRLLPRTQTAWGLLAAGGAFVMLAVGAAVSLSRPKDEEITPDDFGGPDRTNNGPGGLNAAVSPGVPVEAPAAGTSVAGA